MNSRSAQPDFDIKHFLPKTCPVTGGEKLILVCGNVKRKEAKICLQVLDCKDECKWRKEFCPGKLEWCWQD